LHDQIDYMDSSPEQSNTNPAVEKLNFHPTMERNHLAAHGFITENQEEDESNEGNTLSLCFEAFDIMRRGLKVMKQVEIQNDQE
jgi:hypothetical protein